MRSSPRSPAPARSPCGWCCAAATLATALLALPAAAQPAAPRAPAAAPAYVAEVGDDWRAYRSHRQLRDAGRFWWFREGEDVYRHVRLVPDPLFGQVARIVFAASPETGYAPKMSARFPRPLERMWLRWRMRFSPGFTTEGPTPAGYANAYKVAFWLWEGYEGRGQVELSNTSEYVLGWAVKQPGGDWLRYRKTHLPGHREWGHVTSEWTDGEWWEFVIFYDRRSDDTARQHWWKRRLTRDGRTAPGPWAYSGIEVSGAPVPRANAVMLGANRNKSTPREMHIDWGPWEVVDGTRYADPFGVRPP